MVKDMTSGSPAKHMILFAVPLLFGNVFQQFYNFTDAAIVGKTLGYKALAAVGGTSGAIMFLVFGFSFGLTCGLAVVTGQRFGANDPEGVRKSAAASFIISSVFSITAGLICYFLTPQILFWMNTPDDLLSGTGDYMKAMFLGSFTLVFYGMISSILRALGDTVTPLVFLIISCIVNVGLDLLFILSFGWGISGAAWATVIAQALSGILCLIYVIYKFPILRLRACNWNVSKAFYMEHLRIAVPMALQFSITAVGCVVLQAVLNNFGAVYISATTAASKIDQIAIQPIFSFGIAMAAFAAQNYGARKPERIRRGVWSCSLLSLSFSTVIGGLSILFAAPLSRFFVGNVPEVVDASVTFLRICCSFYWVLTMLLIYRNVLQGMGHTFYPMMAGVAELFLRVFAALVLTKSMGYPGTCIAHPLAWIGATVILFADYIFVMKKILRDGIPSKDSLVRRTEALYRK